MRWQAAIVKPGFNPLGTQTVSYTYYLYSWGNNQTNGPLGLSNLTNYSSPKQVGSLTNWLSVSANYSNSYAIKTDGTLWSWGKNNQGQLGLGNTTSYSSPKQVGALTTWATLVDGFGASMYAIKTDGTLWAWGYNNYGQLGDGSITSKSSPVQIGALTNWLSISAGYYYAVSVKTNGTLWSWGYNGDGQLVIGSVPSYYSSPKQVGSLTTWSSVKAGYSYTFALKTDGTVWSWGANAGGQLGLNNITRYSSPMQVGSLTNWLRISAGGYFSVAIKTDGTLWTWGTNIFGQLGLGNRTYYSSPKQVGSLTTWSTISGGKTNTAAIKTDGTLWSWGQNAANAIGQLGINNITNYSSPKQVGSLTSWYSVSFGVRHSLALGY